MALFIIGVVAAAWFGGGGPGVFAAFLSALVIPHVIAFAYPQWMDYSFLADVFDLQRFITLGLTGAAVGWGRRSFVDEAALRRSEDRYARAMAAAEAGFWDWDVTKDEFFASERLLSIFKFAPGTIFTSLADFIGRAPLHPVDLEKSKQAVKTLFKSRDSRLSMEIRVIDGDETRWYRLDGMCFRNKAAGRVVRWTGSSTDITERKRAEDALRLSAERDAVSLEVTQEGNWDWNVQTDEFYASPQTLRVYGVPLETKFRLRSEGLGMVQFHPEDWSRASNEWRAALAGRGIRHEFEYRILRDGEFRWIQSRWRVFRSETGAALRVIGVVSDITKRKRAEEALRESQQRYERVVLALDAGLWDHDVERDEYYVSPRGLELCSLPRNIIFAGREDFMRRNPMHPDDGRRYEQAVRDLFASDRSRLSTEFRVIINGEMQWRHVEAICFRDAKGKVVRWTGSFMDITERKRAEEALRVSQEALRLSEGRYAVAMEVAEEGHFDWTVQTDEIFASPQALRVMGVREDIKYRTRRDIIKRVRFHPDDWPLLNAELSAMLAGLDTDHECEYRIMRGEDARLIRWRWKVFRDESSVAVRVIGIVADITERKRSVEALRLSEERYARAMEAAQDSHWDWNVATGEYYLSPNSDQMWGFPPGTAARVATRDDCHFVAPWLPEDRDRWLRATQELFAGTGDRIDMVIRAKVRGDIIWAQLKGVCSRDATGKVVRFSGSARDVTESKLAEQQLRLSQERYALAMEVTEDGHWDWNVQTDEIFVSQQALRVVGAPLDRKYRTRSEVMAYVRYHEMEDIAARWRAALADTGTSYQFEYRLLRGDETRWILGRWNVFRDTAGVAQRVIGTVVDITERKRAEAELRASEARFATLFRESPGPIAVHRLSDGRAIDINPAWSETFGYTRDQVIGRNTRELGLYKDPSQRETFYAMLTRDGVVPRLSMTFLRGDGEERNCLMSARLIEFGGETMFVISGIDITERKRAEEALRQSEERYALAVEGSNEGIFDWDLTTDRVYVSHRAQELAGLPRGELWRPRRDWRHILAFHPDDAPRLHDAIKSHIEGNRPTFDEEFRILLPDGGVRWLRQRGIALRDASGKAYRIVGSTGDVTERHKVEEEMGRLEQRLRLAQRLESMGTLAGGIAHDFNNILGAILGYGEMALRDATKGSRLRRDLDSIMAAGERGRSLVDRVLAFSRSAVGELVPVHVEAVVREALDQVAARLPENVTIAPRLRAGRAATLGDATQVHQVVTNLASNAAQAMPQGGVLSVSLEAAWLDAAKPATVGSLAAGDYLVLKVSDTGTGIPPKVLERMFDPFFTTKEVGVGSGLGLSLVHGIVTSAGGAIDIATELGKGTTFTVYLRRSGDAPEKRAEGSQPLLRGNGERVIVVDDEEPLVRLATETLEHLGYSPTGFTSSAAALAAFRANPGRFDAVLTDERMPGMSGSALMREVRGIRDDIPVVLMSGYVGVGSVEADLVVKKPLSARDLATCIARALQPEPDGVSPSAPSRPNRRKADISRR